MILRCGRLRVLRLSRPMKRGFGDLYDIYSEAVIVVAREQWELVNLLEAVLDIDSVSSSPSRCGRS